MKKTTTLLFVTLFAIISTFFSCTKPALKVAVPYKIMAAEKFRKGGCLLERMMAEMGLVDVQSLDSSIRVELKYSSSDNFLNKDLYGCLEKAFLQPEVAGKLIRAAELLREADPSLRLLVYDAARPQSIQKLLWESLDMPAGEKGKFAAHPNNGSLHNFGAAVDITICSKDGTPLDMGTPYDFIGEPAYPVMEHEMLVQGKLTESHIENRKLLRKVMYAAGFFNIQTEWWHFNACRRETAREKYPIIP